ncbi:hypothetical protein GCM10010954_15270 [Halobacillus andaensis]|uniref:Uncharacterized protein n=1 Tax=Halobacillus andaensis TaxID=1176239 RepID=A0A917EUD4_HALAA|nr:hypothetical protein [Halobacillus andaensis]MBP2004973.1 hypothetical protein [Halobacillus andaensis]GGF17485.1 hypothetical protein GCM10010954_15270 [Halobacillus andaensis]
MSHTIKERKQSNKLSTGIALCAGLLGGALLRSKLAPDDPSIRKTTKDYVKGKYTAKTDKLNEVGKRKYERFQIKKQGLKSEARKDAITQK